jgi:cell division protease FtsH
MALKKKPKRPINQRVGDLLLWVGGILLISYILLPRLVQTKKTPPRVPYSLFIQQVDGGKVKAARLGEKEILYQLKEEGGEPGQILATTPIFDLTLPRRLEQK